VSFPLAGLHGAHLRRDIIASLGRSRLDAALRSGELRALWTGVVVESARWLDPWTRAAAALLLAGPGSVLTGVTAAFLHGCTSCDASVTHVLVPYGRCLRSRAGLVVHHGGFFADDVAEREGLRVLPLDRVVAEVLCIPRRTDALALVDEALRLAGDQHEQLRKSIGVRLQNRQDPRGTVLAAGLLDLASPRADSAPESWLRLRLVDDGYPIPEVNWPIVGLDGQERYRIDLAWPGLRIALEYDGYEAHEGREARDDARQSDLERRGWIVIRVGRDDLRDLTRVKQELRDAFARRGYTW
jgi:Protein of unknown function (DUF559)